MNATYEVIYITSEGETRFEVSEDEYLLSAASRAGLELPFTCLQGWCITCAGRLEEGRVDQSEAVRVFPEDEAAGYVLLCSAYPRSDLRIRTHQKAALRSHRKAFGLPAPEG
ncbi:MAG: 2Fe-2S iron-sulfur cluster-binding protein [Gemmatimonadota bacterium]